MSRLYWTGALLMLGALASMAGAAAGGAALYFRTAF